MRSRSSARFMSAFEFRTQGGTAGRTFVCEPDIFSYGLGMVRCRVFVGYVFTDRTFRIKTEVRCDGSGRSAFIASKDLVFVISEEGKSIVDIVNELSTITSPSRTVICRCSSLSHVHTFEDISHSSKMLWIYTLVGTPDNAKIWLYDAVFSSSFLTAYLWR